MVAETPEEKLSAGLAQLNCPLCDTDQARLIRFLDSIRRWNRVINLTSIIDPLEMVVLHLLDSLAIAPYIKSGRIADVGTGAGLPGIPLAVACPQNVFALVDSRGKRTRFVQQMAIELGLKNIESVHSRVEDFHPSEGFDTVVSRAFASLSEMVSGCAHLLAPQGRFIAMKGVDIDNDLASLPAGFEVRQVVEIRVPGLEGGRSVIDVRRTGEHG